MARTMVVYSFCSFEHPAWPPALREKDIAFHFLLLGHNIQEGSLLELCDSIVVCLLPRQQQGDISDLSCQRLVKDASRFIFYLQFLLT